MRTGRVVWTGAAHSWGHRSSFYAPNQVLGVGCMVGWVGETVGEGHGPMYRGSSWGPPVLGRVAPRVGGGCGTGSRKSRGEVHLFLGSRCGGTPSNQVPPRMWM